MCLFIGGAVGGCCVLEWETPSRFGLLRHTPSRSHKIRLYHLNLETLKTYYPNPEPYPNQYFIPYHSLNPSPNYSQP